MTTQIGFIGQGWIGRHYADEFESRMYDVVRYSLEAQYVGNKDRISACSVVFIAVPTPTTPDGFDYSIVEEALTLVGAGNIAVIKSTLLPGTTEKLQTTFPDIFVLHSPEFLVEKTAAYDAAKPQRNLIGIPVNSPKYIEKAEAILRILPEAPYNKIMSSRDAEMVKYAGNCFLFTKVIFMNLLYDIAEKSGCNFEDIREAFIHDPRIGQSHTQPVHTSGHINGIQEATQERGAGGHCLIKDFEAFRTMYAHTTHDTYGDAVLKAMAEMNVNLLLSSNKDKDLLEGVYGTPPTVHEVK
jgi:UDPglucose 6-dehydrogenase